jgi:hypothetical protein
VAPADDRVIPSTSWPAARSVRDSGMPMAPVAPAINTFLGNSLLLNERLIVECCGTRGAGTSSSSSSPLIVCAR